MCRRSSRRWMVICRRPPARRAAPRTPDRDSGVPRAWRSVATWSTLTPRWMGESSSSPVCDSIATPAAHDVLQNQPALQRSIAEINPQNPAEQPLGRAQAALVLQLLLAQRDQVACRSTRRLPGRRRSWREARARARTHSAGRSQRLAGCRVARRARDRSPGRRAAGARKAAASRTTGAPESELERGSDVAGKNMVIGCRLARRASAAARSRKSLRTGAAPAST